VTTGGGGAVAPAEADSWRAPALLSFMRSWREAEHGRHSVVASIFHSQISPLGDSLASPFPSPRSCCPPARPSGCSARQKRLCLHEFRDRDHKSSLRDPRF
jgi:hypothetical protein